MSAKRPGTFLCHAWVYGCTAKVPDRPGRFLYCCTEYAAVFNSSPAFLQAYREYVQAAGTKEATPMPVRYAHAKGSEYEVLKLKAFLAAR